MQRPFLGSLALVAAILLLTVGGPWLVRELRTLPRQGALAARADQRIVALEVGGMTCAGCAAKVKVDLVAIPGVSSAEVRLAQHRAYVVCDKTVPDSALTGAVGRAGPGFLAAIAAR
jgi:copper chaperone CopZ